MRRRVIYEADSDVLEKPTAFMFKCSSYQIANTAAGGSHRCLLLQTRH